MFAAISLADRNIRLVFGFNNVCFILFIRKYKVRKLTVNCMAVTAPKSSDSYPSFVAEFRPYQSSNVIVVFKLPSTFGAD
jgi:hypothetical protein